MKKILLATAFLLTAGAGPLAAAEMDWSKVDTALGKKGTALPGEVYRVTFPRTDLQVTLDGVALKPGFALGTHLEFMPMGDQAMVMGDLVLAEAEVNPVMKRLIEGGIDIAAIHNHLLRAQPPVAYMHVSAMGEPSRLAQTIRSALEQSKTPLAAAPAPAAAAAPPDLALATIESALALKGTDNGGIYQFSVPRAETVTEGGMTIPPTMGIAIAINFQPTGGNKAAITGDFVLLGKEVNPVLRELRANDIEVTALHSHMLQEEPRLLFMHFWAHDDAAKLAKGLRAALDKANVKKPEQVGGAR